MSDSNIFLFSGTSNLLLARKIAKNLKVKLGKITIKRFADGEIYVNVREEVWGKNCFIIQSCSTPGNENLMELLIIIDAVRRLKPKKIIACIPFYPYRRQERKVETGEAVTADLCAKLLSAAGVDRLIVLDLHSRVIEKFFRVPYKHLTAFSLFLDYFKKKRLRDAVVIAPDQGAFSVNKKLARQLKIPVGHIYKSRMGKHEVIARMKLTNRVLGKNVIMLDDEISTAGTLVAACQLLKKEGAKNIYFACTHPVLADPAIARLRKAAVKEVVVTDSIYLPPQKRIAKIKVVSVAKLIAKSLIG